MIPLIKFYRMSLISAGSISLDSTFKTIINMHNLTEKCLYLVDSLENVFFYSCSLLQAELFSFKKIIHKFTKSQDGEWNHARKKYFRDLEITERNWEMQFLYRGNKQILLCREYRGILRSMCSSSTRAYI